MMPDFFTATENMLKEYDRRAAESRERRMKNADDKAFKRDTGRVQFLNGILHRSPERMVLRD